jgi:uncharacterized protein (TIGR03437 family)
MRKYLCALPVLVLVGAFLPAPAWAHNNPQPDNFAVYTGDSRFSDSTCADCHTAGNSGNVKLSFNGNSSATSYTPGATIPIQITVTDTGGGRNVWGFELATRFANGKQAGTLAVTNVGCPSSNTNCTALLGSIFSPPAQPGLTLITHNNVVAQPGTTFTFSVNWTAPAASTNPGTIYFSAAGNAANGDDTDEGDRIYTTEVVLTQGVAVSPPSVPSNGIVEGAGFTATISAGGIGSIFGTNLASANASVISLPLPTTLGGTSVTMNGINCGLFFVSSGQINFQVPWELQSAATASLIVTTAGGASPAVNVTMSSGAPGIFKISGVTGAPNQGAVQIANSSPPIFVAPVGSITGVTSSPATAGQFITIYASGLGAVTNQPADGTAAGTGTTLATAKGTISVTVGGVTAPFSFAGLSPGFVGLYQVNVQIPSGLGTNSAAPVIVTLLSTTNQTFTSNTATIAVH